MAKVSSPRAPAAPTYSWNMQPPAAPVFDPVYYPAFLKESRPILKAALPAPPPGFTKSSDYKIRDMDWDDPTTDANWVRVSDGAIVGQAISAYLDLIQEQRGPTSQLITRSPYERYLHDYHVYVSAIEALKTNLHHKKVADREIRKKYKLGIATADTPSMLKGQSFRYSTHEAEMSGDLKSHLAWHPRAKQQPATTKKPELKQAREELRKAVNKAKVDRALNKAAVIAKTTAKANENKAAQAELVQEQRKVKLDFAKAVLSNKAANTAPAAKAVSGAQLARASHKLESTENKRARNFNKNGLPVAFPKPLEGGFLRPATVSSPMRNGNWNQIRFGSIPTLIPGGDPTNKADWLKKPLVNMVPLSRDIEPYKYEMYGNTEASDDGQ